MYWEKDVETKDRGSIEAFQLLRFNETVKIARKSPYYHTLFLEIGLDSDGIESLESIKNIPFTTKDDLRENWPYGLLAVPRMR